MPHVQELDIFDASCDTNQITIVAQVQVRVFTLNMRGLFYAAQVTQRYRLRGHRYVAAEFPPPGNNLGKAEFHLKMTGK